MENKSSFESRWVHATSEQQERYRSLIKKYQYIQWNDKEKSYLLWLCNLDIHTLDTLEDVFEKLEQSS
ncbi:hypothetical protein DOK78_002609 [Enterococcus sp. DIV2402]|uniref:Uncharacterized protein n=1 Tax=Candidatus Enterococcus lowellii TaxID=2230877 RepID=A0ABZ2SQA8_9ENTE|nr:hypothetical protein [Enterococcus sp. DIV2402]MBO0463277.1 hypothetical protein [Enterococcus sp. DIV2402]